jgi:hypothetical protein
MVTTAGPEPTPPQRAVAFLERHSFTLVLALVAAALALAPVPFASIGGAALIVAARLR